MLLLAFSSCFGQDWFNPQRPHLALARADVVERHGALARAHGDAVTALVVTHHVEPEGETGTFSSPGIPGDSLQ